MSLKHFCDSFLKQIKTDDFQQHHKDKRLSLFKGILGTGISLFSDNDLEAWVRFHKRSAREMRMMFYGKQVNLESILTEGRYDFSKLQRLHKGGATLNCNGLQNTFNILRYLVKNLEHIFGCYSHCNAYLTPSGSRGLDSHSDKHDVFAVQVKGSKTWSFFDVEKGDLLPLGSAYSDTRLTRTEEITTCPGDILYIPRGVVHCAATNDDGSLHLTFGLSEYYGARALREMIEVLEPELDVLRKSIEAGTSRNDDLEGQLSTLIQSLNKPDLFKGKIERFRANHKDHKEDIDQITLRSIPADNINFEEGVFQVVASQAEVLRELTRNPAQVKSDLWNKASLLSSAAAKAVQRIIAMSQFSARDLSEFSSEREQGLFLYYLWTKDFIDEVQD